MCTEKTSGFNNPLEPYSKQLSTAIDLIKDAYVKAGLDFPDQGVIIDVPNPEAIKTANKFRQCIKRQHMICNENHCCIVFTTWDCDNKNPLPVGTTALVTCQYGGLPYSEGAVIPLGDGKGQRCENRGLSNTQGEWVVHNIKDL